MLHIQYIHSNLKKSLEKSLLRYREIFMCVTFKILPDFHFFYYFVLIYDELVIWRKRNST